MGWFSGEHKTVRSREPYACRVHSKDGNGKITWHFTKYFDEDTMEKHAKLSTIQNTWITTAKEEAYRWAYRVAKDGYTLDGVKYPAHRVHRVEIVPCTWELEEIG